jgi:hypothetical protein
MLLVHRRDVIETVEIRHGLQIGLGLHQLFCAAMQKTNMRIHAGNNFAIKFKHKAQNTMRRRMLRAKVDVEVTDAMFSHCVLPGVMLFTTALNSPLPSRRPEARSLCLPTATGSRNCGIPV